MAARRVLLVEDQMALARTYQGFLRQAAYELKHVDTGRQALEELDRGHDAVLLDLKLPDMDGKEILRAIGEQKLRLPVIVITAHGSMQTAIEAMRSGASDFLVKPFSGERLRVTLNNALEKRDLAATVQVYRERIDRRGLQGFIGSSLQMQAVYRAIESAATSRATVFLTGESGTGKEVAARAVHDLSGRRGAFVALNCAAIPRDLAESEVFGHVKGAFTSAVASREGAARRSEGGTLFLDEICEMDLSLQSKLLRYVQTGQFTKVGGSEVETVDARIVCATNRDPRAEVRAGRFREDLFYRLHVIPIHLPALRERGNDVVEIAREFFRVFAAQEGRKVEGLTEGAEAVLLSHPWPGNVRELQNVVRNTIVMNHAPIIDADQLAAIGRLDAPSLGCSEPSHRDLHLLAEQIRPLVELERSAIEHALRLCHGDVRKAAVLLEIAPATIYRRLKSWGR